MTKVTIVHKNLDAIVDGMFKLDRASISATTSLVLSQMILMITILLVPTAS